MQNLILLLVCVLFGISASANTTKNYILTDGEKILGQWTNTDQTRVLEFFKNGSVYEAIVVEADDPAHIGQKPITSLKYKKENVYKGGTIHLIQKNKTANCSATLISDTQMKLKVSMAPMSKSVVWTKIVGEP